MLGIHELWLFVLSGLLLNVTPGPDTAYIIGRTIQHGWRGGAAAAVGISCGCLVHVLGAAIGLSALLMASSTAFLAVKLIGAAYLVLTGLQMLLSRAKPIADIAGQGGETSISRVFWQGALTNILNPKVALFFLAFVPQFIAPGTDNKALAFVLLGVLFNVNAIPVNVGWALAAGWMARRSAVRKGMHWLDRVAGVLFIGFGLKLAFTDAPAAIRVGR